MFINVLLAEGYDRKPLSDTRYLRFTSRILSRVPRSHLVEQGVGKAPGAASGAGVFVDDHDVEFRGGIDEERRRFRDERRGIHVASRISLAIGYKPDFAS
ncbi:MAG: hypothetical protein P4L99_06155 [Chthoniobacter sp.]|nr:hypothetical protein [Chthoniobacter sp.]